MALPLRRVVLELAIKLGRRHEEIEQWSMETIREYIVIVTAGNIRTPRINQQSDNEIVDVFNTVFGKR